MLARELDVAADMRSRGGFEVETSGRRTAEYSSDASLYRVVPAAVAFPRSAEDIATALQVCHDHGVPLVLRGAGTSIAGNAVGAGVVLDASRHLRAVLSIDAQARTAVVEPGVVLDDLQRAAAAHGLRFGPDPSTHNRCTIGGMIGNNACGSRALAYGRTSDNVLSLDVITGTGELLQAQWSAAAGASPTLAGLQRVVAANLSVIRTELGRFSRQVSGYALEHLLPENGRDVARFLTGSEGTCAVTTAATLRLVPVPPVTVLVVLGYPGIAEAADAAPGLLPLSPVTVDGLDSRIVELVQGSRARRAVPELPGVPGGAAGPAGRRCRLGDRARPAPGGGAMADPGRRRGPGLPAARRTKSLRGLGRRGGAAPAARGLPARVRGIGGAARASRPAVRSFR